MKLLLIQKDISDIAYLAHFDRAKSKNPDLVCLGELAVSGCLYDGGEGFSLQQIITSLADYGFAVMLGFPHRKEEGLFNSYIFCDDGQLDIYEKINLFEPMNETQAYVPGSQPKVFDSRFGRLGMAICYDLRFPELFEQLAKMGAETVFVPAAFPRVRIADWRELLVKRAVDNKINVIGINAVGSDDRYEFGGSSMVVSSSGEILAAADETSETILEVEL